MEGVAQNCIGLVSRKKSSSSTRSSALQSQIFRGYLFGFADVDLTGAVVWFEPSAPQKLTRIAHTHTPTHTQYKDSASTWIVVTACRSTEIEQRVTSEREGGRGRTGPSRGTRPPRWPFGSRECPACGSARTCVPPPRARSSESAASLRLRLSLPNQHRYN
jgi:hypothetical protein